VPGLHSPPHHAVSTGHRQAIGGAVGAGTVSAGHQHRLLLVQRPQVQVRLQQLSLQLTTLLGEHLRKPIMRPCPGRGRGELSDQTVKAVPSRHKHVSGDSCVVRFHPKGSSPGAARVVWHLRT
jgi:hypothetical protein